MLPTGRSPGPSWKIPSPAHGISDGQGTRSPHWASHKPQRLQVWNMNRFGLERRHGRSCLWRGGGDVEPIDTSVSPTRRSNTKSGCPIFACVACMNWWGKRDADPQLETLPEAAGADQVEGGRELAKAARPDMDGLGSTRMGENRPGGHTMLCMRATWKTELPVFESVCVDAPSWICVAIK